MSIIFLAHDEKILSNDPQKSNKFFEDLVMISYLQRHADNSFSVYYQSNVLCDNVLPGVYVLKGAASLCNPHKIADYLLIVVEEMAVKFTRNCITVHGHPISRKFDVHKRLESLMADGASFRITFHFHNGEEVVVSGVIESVSPNGRIFFKEDSRNVCSVFDVFSCSFIRMQVF